MCKVYCGKTYSHVEEIVHVSGTSLEKDWEDFSEDEKIFYTLVWEDEYERLKYWGCHNSMCYHCYGGG